MNLLIIRPDRLGDVILSTPVLDAILDSFPHARITFMVRDFVAPILKGLPSIHSLMEYDPNRRHHGFFGFQNLVKDLQAGKFDAAIMLQTEKKIAAAVFAARIPIRIGPQGKFHSFLFFNRGVRQKRSRVERHEAEYNLELLSQLGVSHQKKPYSTQVSVSHETKLKARQWLDEAGWNSKEKLIAIHPGMGGSALNWPLSHYVDLIQSLLNEGRQLVITGGGAESSLLDEIEKKLRPASGRALFYRASPQATIEFLGGIYEHTDLVIAPSTGPLHLAVALKKPVVSFYPPIQVQSAKRWGPYAPERDSRLFQGQVQAQVYTPNVVCLQKYQCLGQACPDFPCMEKISVESVLDGVRSLINLNSASQK